MTFTLSAFVGVDEAHIIDFIIGRTLLFQIAYSVFLAFEFHDVAVFIEQVFKIVKGYAVYRTAYNYFIHSSHLAFLSLDSKILCNSVCYRLAVVSLTHKLPNGCIRIADSFCKLTLVYVADSHLLDHFRNKKTIQFITPSEYFPQQLLTNRRKNDIMQVGKSHNIFESLYFCIGWLCCISFLNRCYDIIIIHLKMKVNRLLIKR